MSNQTHHPSNPVIREVAVMPTLANPLPAVVEQAAMMVFGRFSDRLKARLNGRQERALQLALNGHVIHKAARVFMVRSQDNLHTYMVNLESKFCSCPDSRRGELCKHRLAAYLIEQANQATQPQPDETIEKLRKMLQARSDFLQEVIIYATLRYEGESLRVEIIDLEGEAALVRALPEIKDGSLKPCFPFQGRKSCTRVLARSLTGITFHR